MRIFVAPYHGVSFPWHEAHILTRSYEGQVPILVITSQNRMLTIPHGVCQFWQHLSCNFEKKRFLSGIIIVRMWIDEDWIDGEKTLK